MPATWGVAPVSETTTARGSAAGLTQATTPSEWLIARYERLVELEREVEAVERAAMRIVGTIWRAATPDEARVRAAAHRLAQRGLAELQAERDALAGCIYDHTPLPKGDSHA